MRILPGIEGLTSINRKAKVMVLPGWSEPVEYTFEAAESCWIYGAVGAELETRMGRMVECCGAAGKVSGKV